MSDLVLSALSKAVRAVATITRTGPDFVLSWEGEAVLRVRAGHTPREVVAIYVPSFLLLSRPAFRKSLNIVFRMSGLGAELTYKRGTPAIVRGGQGTQTIIPGLWYVWNRRDGATRCRTAFRDDVVEIMEEMTWRPAPVVVASTRPAA